MKVNISLVVMFFIMVTSLAMCNIERRGALESSRNLSSMADTTNHYRHAYKVSNDVINGLEEDNESLKKQLKDYKNVNNITTVTTVTKIDTIFMAYNDTIPCVFTTDVDINNTFYQINATVSNEGLGINLIKFPNETSIVVGDKKIRGFLGITKGTEYAIGVTHTNPYMKTVNLQHYTITKKKRWYETTPFLVGAGLITGILIAK